MKPNILVFDVESTSLHGTGFAVGAVVLEKATGKEVANFLLKSYEGEGMASDWVKENVLPSIKNMPAVSQDQMLRDRFWKFYLEHKDTCDIWADVAYPVETNFLEQLYKDSPTEREFMMPYPLFDVSTHFDVDIDRDKKCGLLGLMKHNPADDAKASATILVQLMHLMNEWNEVVNLKK